MKILHLKEHFKQFKTASKNCRKKVFENAKTAILSSKTAERACFDDGIAEELCVWGFAGPSGVQIYSKQIKNSL